MNSYCSFDGKKKPGSDYGKSPDFGTDVKPVISATTDYNLLDNRPAINGVMLVGDKTNRELLIDAITNEEIENLLKNFA